jgi:hypothetical protein
MLIVRLEVPKRKRETLLVCIEPAQLLSDGISVARSV